MKRAESSVFPNKKLQSFKLFFQWNTKKTTHKKTKKHLIIYDFEKQKYIAARVYNIFVGLGFSAGRGKSLADSERYAYIGPNLLFVPCFSEIVGRIVCRNSSEFLNQQKLSRVRSSSSSLIRPMRSWAHRLRKKIDFIKHDLRVKIEKLFQYVFKLLNTI
jgi:hypothetical protein